MEAIVWKQFKTWSASNLRAKVHVITDLLSCAYSKHTLFFSRNIVFPADAEYSYFSADFRLKIFLLIFLDLSVWQFCFRMYLLFWQCLSNSGASSLQALNLGWRTKLYAEMLSAYRRQIMQCCFFFFLFLLFGYFCRVEKGRMLYSLLQ